MNLCGVACGRLDAFYEVGFGGCWDAAAGKQAQDQMRRLLQLPELACMNSLSRLLGYSYAAAVAAIDDAHTLADRTVLIDIQECTL